MPSELTNAAQDAQQLAASLVQDIVIESRLLPTFTVNQPFVSSGQPGEPSQAPSWLVQLLQPKVTVRLSSGDEIAIAPAGDPDPTGLGKVLLLAWAAFLGLGAVEGAVRHWKLALGLAGATAGYVFWQSRQASS